MLQSGQLRRGQSLPIKLLHSTLLSSTRSSIRIEERRANSAAPANPRMEIRNREKGRSECMVGIETSVSSLAKIVLHSIMQRNNIFLKQGGNGPAGGFFAPKCDGPVGNCH